MCGGQARLEAQQGKDDDSALNGIRFKFCDFKIVRDIQLTYDLNAKVLDTKPQSIKSSIFYNPTTVTQ